MNSSADNPFASPQTADKAERIPNRTFVGIPRVLGRKEHFYKFFITEGKLLGGVLHGPLAHPYLVQLVFAVTLLVGASCLAALSLWLPQIATFIGWYLVLMFIGVVIGAIVLQQVCEQQLRQIAKRYSHVSLTLEAFKQVDPECFAIEPGQVASLRIKPRGTMSVRRDIAGHIEIKRPAALSSQQTLRIVVVGPYDITAISEELAKAGFAVRG